MCIILYLVALLSMKKRVTIKDIAAALDTNSSTVSRALNNHPGISPQTKKRVHAMAKSMGYAPNSIARQLRSGQSKTIGLVVPHINRTYFANFIHGMEVIAKSQGYQVLMCQSNDSSEEEWNCIQILTTQDVAGIVISIASDQQNEQAIQSWLERDIPMVMFDRAFLNQEVSMVLNGDREGTYLATRHLLKQGYRRILYFGGPKELNVYGDRFEGYAQALREANISLDDSLIVTPLLTREEGAACMQDLLARGVAFDALCASSDFLALGAMLVMQEAGIDIPGEKGVIGFANEPFTELVHMSSIEQFSVEMGDAAAKLIIEQIESPKPSLVPKRLVIPPKLVVRKSTMRTRQAL